MADYDVGVVGLSVPAQSAPVTTYRPAVRVRNNGIHPANVTGTCRQYRREPPGDLLATWPLSLLNLAAGSEGDALAEGYWTPTAADIGHEFLFIADVTTEHDQVESNNHLAPVTVLVTAGVPPPPPPIAAHATQHEKGGADQVNVDDLSGHLADPQTPAGHKTTHQAAGSDVIDVTGLVGILATPQPIADHHETHEDHGGDELNVDDLSGVLKNLQKPKVHGNEAHEPNYSAKTHGNADHDPQMATNADLDTHKAKTETHGTAPFDILSTYHTDPVAGDAQPHQAATNLEHTANKGEAGGYPELDEYSHVPAAQLGTVGASPPEPLTEVLHRDQTWREPAPAEPTAHHESHESGGEDELSVEGLHGQLGDLQVYTPAAHGVSHESGESDEIDVGGLLGTLHDPQTPTSHDNTAHSTTFQPESEKGEANGYAPLGPDGLVPEENLPPSAPQSHKTTHENGGADEISIAGLSGKAADAQDPTAHKTSHQDGGDDEISIAGLSGKAADAQDPVGHHTSHEPGGSDPVTALLAPTRVAYCQEPTPVSWDQNYTYLAIGDKTWSNVYGSLIGNKQVEFDVYLEITCYAQTYLLISIGSGVPGVYYFGSSNYTAGIGTTIIHFRARLTFYEDGQGYSTAECGQTLHACAPWGSVTKVDHGGPNQMPPGNLHMGIMITHDQPALPPIATIANGQIILWPVD